MVFLEEKLYTSEETASILGISLRTLYRYLKKGEIEAETKTQSGTFRFTRKQIYKYLYPDRYSKILETLKNSQNKTQDKITYIDEDSSATQVQNTNEGDLKNVDSSLDLKKDEVATPEETQPAINSEQNSDQHNDVSKVLADSANNLLDSNTNTNNASVVSTPITTSKPYSDEEAKKITEQRDNVDLDDELKSLEDLLDVSKTQQSTPGDNSLQNSAQVQQTPPTNNQNQINSNINLSANTAQSPLEVPSHTNNSSQSNLNTNDLNSPLPSTSPASNDSVPSSNSANLNNEVWKYFINSNKDILDLAREISSISNETGRKYAATMRGGLSLHHDIDEFNIVHFYVSKEDFNWYVSELGLQPCSEADANICLISTSDSSIFESSYKLRGLQVVSDSRLIQDLMAHGEKELAKTLL